MSEVNTSRTAVDRLFAGRRRKFQLRIGEIGELERLCQAGIGEIMLRLAGHRFYARDVWETVRLGLEGGGEREMLASGLVERYQAGPIADYIGLASEILTAAVSGIEIPAEPGKTAAEGSDNAPATSPPTSGPAARPARRRRRSAG